MRDRVLDTVGNLFTKVEQGFRYPVRPRIYRVQWTHPLTKNSAENVNDRYRVGETRWILYKNSNRLQYFHFVLRRNPITYVIYDSKMQNE